MRSLRETLIILVVVLQGSTPFVLPTTALLSKQSETGASSFCLWSSTTSTETSSTETANTSTEDNAAKVWRKVASARPSERSNEILVGAKAPPGLAGTYYVNGLASCTFANGRLVHPFESHGFLKSISFDPTDDTVSLNAKYVNTPVRQLEERFQRPLFRGSMSAVADMRSTSWTNRLANALSPTTRETANLAVRKWGDKLLATADNCSFYGMCSENLDTLGTERFKGALNGYKMLAHTRKDTERNRLVACGLAYQPFDQSTDLTFFEFDENENLVSKVEHRLPAFVVHDWTITPNYYIVPAASAVFDLSKLPSLMIGDIPATEVFSLDGNAPGTVLLIPRDGSAPIRAERSDGLHSTIFHVGPTYEDDDGNVIFHPFCFDTYQFGGEMGFDIHKQSFDPSPWSESNGGPKLERWTIGMEEAKATGKAAVHTERLNSVLSDMPTFHPDRDGLECNHVYTVCGIRENKKQWFPFNSIAKHDLRTGKCQIWPPEAALLSREESHWDGGSAVRAEPLFVPRVGAVDEDDGYVLSTAHCSETMKTTLEILDAKNFGAGPISRIDLGELWGWNIHSSFVPAKER